jgi:hypothetical protein
MRPVGTSQNGQVCDDIEAFFEDLGEQLILPVSSVADDASNHLSEADLHRPHSRGRGTPASALSRYYQATAQRETISTFVPSAPLYPCSALTMDSTFAADVGLSADGKLVLFVISARNQSVQCSISREALEQHF